MSHIILLDLNMQKMLFLATKAQDEIVPRAM